MPFSRISLSCNSTPRITYRVTLPHFSVYRTSICVMSLSLTVFCVGVPCRAL